MAAWLSLCDPGPLSPPVSFPPPHSITHMPPYPHTDRCRRELTDPIHFGGSDHELNIRPALQDCLDAYCRRSISPGVFDADVNHQGLCGVRLCEAGQWPILTYESQDAVPARVC